MALKILNNCRPLSSHSQSLSSRRGLQEKSILDCLFQSPVDHHIIAIFPWSCLFLSMPEYESLHDLWHHCHEEIDAVQSSLCFDVFLHCRHESQSQILWSFENILKYVTSLPSHWDGFWRVTKSLHCKNLDVPLPISLQHYSDVPPPTAGELLLLLTGRSRRLAAAGSHLLQAKTRSSLYDRSNLQIMALLELFLIHLEYAWKITQIRSPSIKKFR